MDSFDKGDYQPELLFDGKMLEHIKYPPMAIWKARRTKKKRYEAAVAKFLLET